MKTVVYSSMRRFYKRTLNKFIREHKRTKYITVRDQLVYQNEQLNENK